MSVTQLIAKEGWTVVEKVRLNKSKQPVLDASKQPIIDYFVRTPYENEPDQKGKPIGLIKVRHPAFIHLEIYRKHTSSEVRYQHMKKAHDYFWPDTIWHYWTERRFRAHCENWNYITLAAGASASKSYDVAKIAILFWAANPNGRNVTIASTTLASLMTRVWGYVTKHIKNMQVSLPYKYYRAGSPKILTEEEAAKKNKIDDDTLHGIFAVTAKANDNAEAIATWIGKHPDEKMLLILDEATDMPLSILDSTPNLNSHPEKFQLMAIGNSKSTMDLHGLLSTPAGGWDSISLDLIQWKTTQINGICLYFNPYDSPAVTDPDPARRKILEYFLIGRETLAAKELEHGVESEKFYRWTLGFWKSRDSDEIIASQKFLKEYSPKTKVQWSGYYPIRRCAGLDPAFSSGGDNCILSIGNVGQDMDKKIKMDFSGDSTIFKIPIMAVGKGSAESQIAIPVIQILVRYGVTLDMLAIDCTGQGRAIGEVILLQNKLMGNPLGFGVPLKIYSMSPHNMHKRKESLEDLEVISSFELWDTVRRYIEQGCVCDLDDTSIYQMTNRKVETIKGKKVLESKLEYKRRMAAIGQQHSPDEMDARSLCIQIMLKRMGIKPGTLQSFPSNTYAANVENKMYAMQQEALRANGTISSGGHPKIDFSAGLIKHVKYSKPF